MNIAVVTGASSGLGYHFAKQIDNKGFDEIWLIARREDRLSELSSQLKTKARVIPLDLTKEDSFSFYKSLLEAEKPDISMLINSSGFGKFGRYDDIAFEDADAMIKLNISALVKLTELSLPFMKEGGEIIEIASCAAFQPLPFMNVYAATKAFVLSYSNALRAELKDRRINVLAVTPSWIKTEFIGIAKDTKRPDSVNKFMFMAAPEAVVKKALRDSKKRRAMSVYGFFTKMQRVMTKLSPSNLSIAFWQMIRK